MNTQLDALFILPRLAADVPPVDPTGSGSVVIAFAFSVVAVAAIIFWLVRRKRKR
jgi:LPXTG-motif cell wall-anchored protein